jgi:hypothetical protein
MYDTILRRGQWWNAPKDVDDLMICIFVRQQLQHALDDGVCLIRDNW